MLISYESRKGWLGTSKEKPGRELRVSPTCPLRCLKILSHPSKFHIVFVSMLVFIWVLRRCFFPFVYGDYSFSKGLFLWALPIYFSLSLIFQVIYFYIPNFVSDPLNSFYHSPVLYFFNSFIPLCCSYIFDRFSFFPTSQHILLFFSHFFSHNFCIFHVPMIFKLYLLFQFNCLSFFPVSNWFLYFIPYIFSHTFCIFNVPMSLYMQFCDFFLPCL